MHEVLVNRLGSLSLPRKSVVRLTDRPNMTIDVYCGCKTTTKKSIQLAQFGSVWFTAVQKNVTRNFKENQTEIQIVYLTLIEWYEYPIFCQDFFLASYAAIFYHTTFIFFTNFPEARVAQSVKHCPPYPAVPGSRPTKGGDLFNHKQGSTADRLSLSLAHCLI